MLSASALLLLWTLSTAASPALAACPVIFDGRISSSVVPADFDTSSSVYNDQFVHGLNQTWAEVIKLPQVNTSLFDVSAGTKALEVTLNDNSIFDSSGSPPQLGFRRSELLPAINSGTDATVQGATTVHWSIRSDSTRPFNLSHEHQLVFHESLDFSIDQFMLLTGAPFNETFDEARDKTLKLQGSQTANPVTFFTTPFEDDTWHNFAVTVGWASNDFTVYYSKDLDPLQLVNATTNDNSGQGQQHFGILKLPTGDAGIDVVNQGFQETGLNEGLIYGGIFIEDSSDGCVSLS